MKRSALIVGQDGPNLEASYGRALRALGWNVTFFDLQHTLSKYERFERVGRFFNAFVPVEAWFRKANRDLFLHVTQRRPDVLLVAGNKPIRAGGLAQIKVACPDTRIVLLWPDPLVHLEPNTLASLPVFDLVATYSLETRPLLERLGARSTTWLPFAADFEVHPPEVDIKPSERHAFACDVLFVGNYRPERERAVLALHDAGIDVKVYGSRLWRDGAANRERVSSYWGGRMLFGRELVAASRCARVCVNVIDPGNYPAANMRFFENFAAAVATINTACPEMCDEFPDRVATLYYDDERALLTTTKEALDDADLCARIAQEGARRVRERHTYLQRAESLLETLDIGASSAP